MKLSGLPIDLLSLIYDDLEWTEKMIFILISRKIYFNSKSYRELRLKPTSARNFVFDELFRTKVSDLVCPRKIELDLSSCGQITDEVLAHLGNIRSLNLSTCRRVTDAGLAHLSDVHSLDLSFCHRITDEGLQHLQLVHTLKLRHCRRITDAGLIYLRNVRSLDLGACHQITDAGLAHLSGVHSLVLSFCDQITDIGFAQLEGGALHTLHISMYRRGLTGVRRLEERGVVVILDYF
jgi:hypothetical protein